MTRSFLPSVLRAAGLAAVLAIAACSADKPETAEAAPAPAPAATTEQPADAARANAIGLKACRDASDGRIHLGLGSATLAVPSPLIQDVIPASVQPPVTEAAVKTALLAQTALGEGCPGKPLAVSLAILKGKFEHPLLDGSIGLFALPPGAAPDKFAAVTAQLQKQRSRNCQELGPDLIGCVGAERRGEETVQVMYVITTDRTQKMATGGPLAARCELSDKAIKNCRILDVIQGGVVVDAGLRSGTYTTAGLREALDLALKAVTALRL